MRFNERQLQIISQEEPDYQDRLSFVKYNNSANKNFKERWFKLKSNMLFYFKFTDSGQIETKAAGVIILEGSKLEQEDQEISPFAFSLIFGGDFDKRYIFSAKSEEAVHKWIYNLRIATYEFKRIQYMALRQSISSRRGQKPVVPPRPEIKRQLPVVVSYNPQTAKNKNDELELISFN